LYVNEEGVEGKRGGNIVQIHGKKTEPHITDIECAADKRFDLLDYDLFESEPTFKEAHPP
jgi:hypothetical protein